MRVCPLGAVGSGEGTWLLRPRCCLVVSEALSLLGPAGWWTTGAWWSQRLETWTTLPRSFEVRLGLCWGSSVTAVTPWGHHSPEHLCQGWGLRSQLAQDRGEPFPEEPGGILAAVVCHQSHPPMSTSGCVYTFTGTASMLGWSLGPCNPALRSGELPSAKVGPYPNTSLGMLAAGYLLAGSRGEKKNRRGQREGQLQQANYFKASLLVLSANYICPAWLHLRGSRGIKAPFYEAGRV